MSSNLFPLGAFLAAVLDQKPPSVHRRYLPPYNLSFIFVICLWVFWSAFIFIGGLALVFFVVGNLSLLCLIGSRAADIVFSPPYPHM